MTATAIEGGHVSNIADSNRVIRDIVEARNKARALDIGEELREEIEQEFVREAGVPELFTNEATPAERVLSTAIEATRDRRKNYGHPRDHFSRTIGMINAAFAHKLKEPFDVSDWPLIMSLDKIARQLGPGRHPDNPVDLAGYASTIPELV